ncbi:alpha-glucan family phosphorylase [Anaeromyxobacter oryzae]|uniref:glycogen phosphorylase n=1 Tax=Anaeromyxobacter oryzae TaxID=2918170 RepID=A0ABM7WP25_9BACT|nr:alpha-glucan family phosphorylase [Anaeromyxobacter oryzae]BDG01223.1 alpha-1,4 glucan phosphorylase [Anaeromyxobacter oryzae]
MDHAASQRAQDVLADQLPAPIRRLADIAFDYGWSWRPEGEALWRSVDPELWDACGRNPVRLLRLAAPAALARAAADPALRAAMDRLADALDAARAAPARATPAGTRDAPVAFLCAEYAIHASLPIYSGGLGVLAGDLLKEASDRAVPLVAVGLLYRRGYFHQRLDPSGLQHEYWTVVPPQQLPLERAVDAAGAPVAIEVPLRGHAVHAAVWRAQVGAVPLYLLDSDVPENAPIDRFVTSQLYVGDREYRLMQYALLGVGAVRALAALGIRPGVFHLNEGHPALAALELARDALARGETLERAVGEVRRRIVFTTHTPVAAGNETYAPADVVSVLGPWLRTLGIEPAAALALGRPPGTSDDAPFGMTDLALRTSRAANGVSRRHAEVSRELWARHWPGLPAAEVPIAAVTNGVHLPTWMAEPMRALLARHLGPEWTAHPEDPARWAGVEELPDEELWAVRCRLRADLVAFARARSISDRLARGEPIAYVERADRAFDPAVLTVGFARRVASYKRLHLLVADPARALALLAGPHPMQVVMAGKAHPRDEGAKAIVQRIFELKGEPNVAERVVYLEDHDMEMARKLVAGCDVWVNLPRPPQEASGTSGMKAALNGGLDLSVLDGWWCEAFDGRNGWAIRSEPGPDEAAQDARDAAALYDLLEREVVPLFYDRDAAGVPRAWLRQVKASLQSIGPRFITARTLEDYVAHVYSP